MASPTEKEAKENVDIVSWFLNDYFPQHSKVYENTSGIRSQVSKLVSNEYLREVLNPDWNQGEKNEVDFSKSLAEGGVICISTAQGILRDLSRYLGYFIILSLQSAVFRRPGNEDTRRPHSLYIDEFHTYSTLGFADMLIQGRSYRISSILATQSRAQMAMGGSREGRNFVELVSANARNVILFPGINKDDAYYYSLQFGEIEKIEAANNTSRKKSNLLTSGLDKLSHLTEPVRKKTSVPFKPTDIVIYHPYRPGFSYITYSIIKNHSPQPAKEGLVTSIPKDFDDELDKMIELYTAENARESTAEYSQQAAQSEVKAVSSESDANNASTTENNSNN